MGHSHSVSTFHNDRATKKNKSPLSLSLGKNGTTTGAFTILMLLYTSSSLSVAAAGPVPSSILPSASAGSVPHLDHRRACASFVISKSSLTSKRSNTRTVNPPCFHFRHLVDDLPSSGQPKSNKAASSSSLRPNPHYNDALLNRILTGRNSSDSKWRRKSNRAAAALGIRRGEEVREVPNITTLLPSSLVQLQSNPVPPFSSILKSTAKSIEDIEDESHRIEDDIRSRSRKRHRRRQTPEHQVETERKRESKSITSPPEPSKMTYSKFLTEEQHTTAKLAWAARYTSLHTLRQTFGRNRNKFWGDFDSKASRKLYHTLLPRALLGLYEMGLWSPEDLAPLAYQARLAAKKYARERCVVPGRIMAMVYDGFRSWRDWGTWSVEGLSWEQVWYKYETQVLEEMMEEDSSDDQGEFDLNDIGVQKEITAQICLRILERSCATNGMVDRLFLEDDNLPYKNNKNDRNGNNNNEYNPRKRRRRRRNAERDLSRIKIRLDRDMQELLDANNNKQIRITQSPLLQRAAFASSEKLSSQQIFILEHMTSGRETWESFTDFLPTMYL